MQSHKKMKYGFALILTNYSVPQLKFVGCSYFLGHFEPQCSHKVSSYKKKKRSYHKMILLNHVSSGSRRGKKKFAIQNVFLESIENAIIYIHNLL